MGDSYLVSYTASLDPGAISTLESLSLPAQLTFQSSMLVSPLLLGFLTCGGEGRLFQEPEEEGQKILLLPFPSAPRVGLS